MFKLLNKIIFLFIFIFVLYIVLIFVSPNFANNIWKPLWLEGFNKAVLDFKAKLDKKSTQDFDLWRVVDNTLSWATDIKNKALDTVNGVKTTIDDVRSWVDNTIETYKEVKDQVKETVDTINKTTKQIWEVKQNIEKNFNSKEK